MCINLNEKHMVVHPRKTMEIMVSLRSIGLFSFQIKPSLLFHYWINPLVGIEIQHLYIMKVLIKSQVHVWIHLTLGWSLVIVVICFSSSKKTHWQILASMFFVLTSEEKAPSTSPILEYQLHITFICMVVSLSVNNMLLTACSPGIIYVKHSCELQPQVSLSFNIHLVILSDHMVWTKRFSWWHEESSVLSKFFHHFVSKISQ
jgi:hypothetical protein